ncbi:MAG: M23 family metallopeptidase [Wolbachia endosymbiont of Fragariocoptes setiger]|nr:M23 family metallopeptidase [Wolbachia endosymbiont of Fragariocoptes setiger]
MLKRRSGHRAFLLAKEKKVLKLLVCIGILLSVGYAMPLIGYNQNLSFISTNIQSSLFATGLKKGLSITTVTKLVDIYKDLDVDFKKDITPETQLSVLFERDSNKKEKILYTALKTRKSNISLYYYELKDGYFNQDGLNIKTNFVKPLNVNYRISSKFGNRKHPIHGHISFHKGIDYAVKSGTPIYAAANGTIDFIGNKGGYGKYIRINHLGGYSTCYAHISKFHESIKLGSYVKQGQIIAYVGSTGTATGPHLHYEVIHDGKHIDPLMLEHKNKTKLIDYDLKQFKILMVQIDKIKKELAESYG